MTDLWTDADVERGRCNDDAQALRDRIAVLEGALRPFARPLHPDTENCDDEWPEQRTHKLGDIRHAIATLNGEKKDG